MVERGLCVAGQSPCDQWRGRDAREVKRYVAGWEQRSHVASA